MSAVSLHAQPQRPGAAKSKAEDRKIVGSSSGDKAETEAHFQMSNLGEQLDRADQKKNGRKRIDLSRLQKKLGPDHIALIELLKDVDTESLHGQALASIIENLNQTSE